MEWESCTESAVDALEANANRNTQPKVACEVQIVVQVSSKGI